MLISLCTPCMNRLDDFKETITSKINATKYGSVELVVLDYNSQDGLEDFVENLMKTVPIVYKKYTGRNAYHAAHANNLVMLLGNGDYVVLTPADTFIEEGYIPRLVKKIEQGCIWCTTLKKHRSIVAVKKEEFVNCGGYDERMEMYGPDDVDLIERLERRGGKFGSIPDELIRSIYTSPEKKVENYRIKASHKELGKLSMPYLYENRDKKSLVANLDGWGKWE